MANAQYSKQLGDLPERAVVAYFRAVGWRWYLPSEEQLAGHLQLMRKSLVRIAELEDGAVYVIPAATPK